MDDKKTGEIFDREWTRRHANGRRHEVAKNGKDAGDALRDEGVAPPTEEKHAHREESSATRF
jgi:hypothetical protein